ncbi:MAG TPA: thioredoxin family protein [Polyangium sp.]|jgi:thiol-disulfide isomerase/thioredoxin|nr:thioredoxin family protein [Polyangium sp.]
MSPTWLRSSIAVLLLAGTACGGPQIPADARKTVISLGKIDCADCGDEIVSDMRAKPGVYDAQFDRKKAEVIIVAAPTIDVFTEVRKLAAEDGFEAILGAGKGQYLEHLPFPEGSDVQTVVKDGADVPDISAFLAQGKVTIVDFSASWCGPCRKVDEHVVKIFTGRTDLAYRRLDIGDWDSPLAKHYLANVPQLPHVIVYDKTGKKVDSITGVDLDRIDRAITSATKSP